MALPEVIEVVTEKFLQIDFFPHFEVLEVFAKIVRDVID
jgi:hypothetical protein